jgi:hypothetical protein
MQNLDGPSVSLLLWVTTDAGLAGQSKPGWVLFESSAWVGSVSWQAPPGVPRSGLFWNRSTVSARGEPPALQRWSVSSIRGEGRSVRRLAVAAPAEPRRRRTDKCSLPDHPELHSAKDVESVCSWGGTRFALCAQRQPTRAPGFKLVRVDANNRVSRPLHEETPDDAYLGGPRLAAIRRHLTECGQNSACSWGSWISSCLGRRTADRAFRW